VESPTDRSVSSLSKPTVVDPPSGALNVLVAKPVVIEHDNIEQLPCLGTFTMVKAPTQQSSSNH
jgi:hypothetical protein